MVGLLLGTLIFLDPGLSLFERHERYAFAPLMRDALVQGQLGRVRSYARVTGMLGGEDPHIERIATVADSETGAAAAALIAGIAADCGGCHETAGAHRDRVRDYPPMGSNLLARMGRHVWAAERLWEGLVWRSDEAWLAGASALGLDPFLTPANELQGLEERLAVVQGLAAEAADERHWPERADIYGRFLEGCADCHGAR